MGLERCVTPWAEREPSRVAVDGPDEALTYAELDRLANRFARVLRAMGVGPGDRVGIHAHRSARTVAAMLGTLRAGGVYVPLDPGSPPARLGLIVKDCGLATVVVSPPLFGHWHAAGVSGSIEHFVLTGPSEARAADLAPIHVHPWSEVEAVAGAPIESPGRLPDDLAYVLYTSGSTGIPKGVMLSHGNAAAFVDWAADAIGLREGDRVASVAPFHFDLSVFDVWATLSRGATMVVVDEATVMSGRRMLDRIHAKNIQVWYSVPSALILMLETGGLAERGAPSLRSIFFAGEVFPMKHLRKVMAALPHVCFFNLFGPTETNVCLAYEVPGPPALDAGAIPIGRASCGNVISIVDPEGKEVPDGHVGELLVDGPTVMVGYWDGGRRTPARRPYPTGDMVSRRPDGEILYHGRRDHMVKIHGFRVELGEVESALYAHPAIHEAIALAVDQQLVAVAVPSDPALSVLEVKRHCADRLPRYMIPSDVRLVEGLPRTSNGKVDRVRTREAMLAGDGSILKPLRRVEPRKETEWKRA